MARYEIFKRFVMTLSETRRLEREISRGNCSLLMDRVMMHRTIFEIPSIPGYGKWVRVRRGDIGPEGGTRRSLTYKQVASIGDRTTLKVVGVSVDSYSDCVELLESLGFSRKSEQETRRTKYLLKIGEDRIVITIDEWPWLEDVRFVAIRPNAVESDNRIDDFCGQLKIDKNQATYQGGVDSVYSKRFNFAISDVPEVLFGVDLPHLG